MEIRRLALFLVVLLVASACGGGDTDATTDPSDEPAPTTATVEAGSGETTAPTTRAQETPRAASGAAGSMTVDGELFEGQVIRCEPFSFGSDPHEDDVSVVLFATAGLNVDLSYTPSIDINGGGEYLQASVDLLYSATGGSQFEASATTGIDGNWFERTDEFVQDPAPLPTAPIDVDGNRMAGGMALDQSWPQGETGTVEVTFDIEIPSEITGC